MIPLDCLVRSNLVQQEFTRIYINNIALLNKTVNVGPDVMRELRDLLDRENERQDHEWIETMQRRTITKRTEKRPVAIRSRNVERDCRLIVNQLVNSIPKDILLRTSYVECQQLTGTQCAQGVSVELKSSMARRVQLTDAKKEYGPCSDWSSGDETLSGESCSIGSRQNDLSEALMPGRPKDRIWSGESRNKNNKSEGDSVDSISSSDVTKSQSWENVSEPNFKSDASEMAFHSLLVEWKQRGLDRKMHQDPDTDRYTSDEEGTVVDNAANELELIAVSKRPTELFPHATVVRTNLEPLEQKATPLKKIWCVK